jgi:hypothetical protein
VQFTHEYPEGPLAGAGRWHFEAEWSTKDQPEGMRALQWRGKHEKDTQWRLRKVELGYPIAGQVDDGMVKQHVIGAFAMRLGGAGVGNG